MSKRFHPRAVCFLSLTAPFLLGMPARQGSPERAYVIEADRVYTVSHGILEPGEILIENGKITKVGRSVEAVPGAGRVRAKVVVPGLVDMHTHLGVYSLPSVEENQDGNEMTDPLTPQVRALDSFNFDDPALKAGLAGGVTTIVSRPGSANVIGGTSVAVKLKLSDPAHMVLREDCDLKMAIEGNPVGIYGKKEQPPATLMSVYYLARKAFVEAQEYMKSWDAYEKDRAAGKDVQPPKRDLGKEAIARALRREIPVHIHCATASEIASSIRFADEFHLRLSLGHAYWAHLIVKDLADRKDVHFNIGPPMFFNYYEDALTFRNTPAILANAGLSVSLQTDALGGNEQNLLHLASLCVRYGMKEEDALKAITLAPATAEDLGGQIGSIDEGKDADLVLLNGDPFEFTTSIEKVIIDGHPEYQAEASPIAPIAPALPGPGRQLVLPAGLEETSRIAIKGGTILTMAGDPIIGGTILISNGRIEQVGRGIPVPEGYRVIDASGFVVMPGLVSPRSYVGIASNWRQQEYIDEVSRPVSPELEVKHAIEPTAPHFSYARQLGITTVMVTPGNKEVIGGRGAVIKTAGSIIDRMIVTDQAVMVCGLGQSAKRKDKTPSTRMGIAALLRETLIKGREYAARAALPEDKRKDFKRDLSLEALGPVLEGRMPLMIHCERRDDILTALRLADEFKLKVILDGATDAYRVADELRSRNIPVILEDMFRGAGNIEDGGFNPVNAAVLARAGIKVGFKPRDNRTWVTPGASESGGDLLEIAAFAVKNGMPEQAALRAITIDAASIAGVDDRVGSLAAGKDADVLILRGHPFRTASVAEAVLIDGHLVYHRRDREHLQ